ncbi:unnamed protein product [Cuscuta europaea]|uniref:Pectinesterase n=1 Tax=Cuscuta europaea TaxID=41803 RepID=A0A9P1E9U1_CUSEU|nr:unnamed protein product [Cuscuta europaea]
MAVRSSTILFWLFALSVAFCAVTLSVYFDGLFYTAATSSSAPLAATKNPFSVGFSFLLKKIGFGDLLYAVDVDQTTSSKHHHRRRRKAKCDDLTWDSAGLVSMYGVSRVITVDSKGCGNFSTIKMAIHAVPDLSPAITLIIINSGTYRPVILLKHLAIYYCLSQIVVESQHHPCINNKGKSDGREKKAKCDNTRKRLPQHCHIMERHCKFNRRHH